MDATTQPDIFIVSNRLPVRIERQRSGTQVVRSSGGLASALQAIDGVKCWIGWPGAPVEVARRALVADQLAALGLAPVFLSAEEERHYYHGMCNGTLWPLLHYYPGRIDFHERDWPAYVAVNRRFAEVVAARASQGAIAWVHDFHLLLLPQMLRQLRPDLSIGCFLHVPFPSPELWRILPQREELLRGLLGADYLAFHTPDYLQHFRNSVLRVLGIEAEPDAVVTTGHRTVLGADPMGADVKAFTRLLDGPEVAGHMQRYAEQWRGRRLLLGVERLDYSKGILHKLRAFARLLEQQPERAKDTVMLQVLVPSREENENYRSLLREIEREVGRINGRFGAPGCMPLEFLHRSIEPAELAALYRHAEVALVTPVRDGMNLVAHEFVLCQGHPQPEGSVARGALVLSEFAGAAQSLTRALSVNPWDQTGLSAAIEEALALSLQERALRIAEMHERVVELDSARWADRFLQRLARATGHNRVERAVPLDAARRIELQARWQAAPLRELFLDYDGTLTEIRQRPEQAAPNAELLALLRRLAQLPGTTVHLVSGRRRQTLADWFGHLPIRLCAEHGFAVRGAGGAWNEPLALDRSWLPAVHALMTAATEQVPGSFLEEKGCGYAWHYRLAEPGYGSFRARELREQLDRLLLDIPAETMVGHAVLEVRARGVNKGSYVAARLREVPGDAFVLVAGDDRTDLDMYAQLPVHGYGVHIGGGAPNGVFVLSTPAEFRAFLRSL